MNSNNKGKDELMDALLREDVMGGVDEALLGEAAERQLYQQLQLKQKESGERFTAGEYLPGLELLAELRPAVDAFFDDVMVMVDEEDVRDNRLALLGELRALFLDVADISRLSLGS